MPTQSVHTATIVILLPWIIILLVIIAAISIIPDIVAVIAVILIAVLMDVIAVMTAGVATVMCAHHLWHTHQKTASHDDAKTAKPLTTSGYCDQDSNR